MDNTVKNNFMLIEFAEQVQPNFIAQKGKDWVLYGDKNDYIKYLIDLYNRHAEHGAIVSGKTAYISGKGLVYDKTKVEDVKEQAKLDKFLASANRFQSWSDILPMMVSDLELFNGYALQVIYGAGGKVVSVYHIEFSKVRLSKDGKSAYVCDNWYVSNPAKEPSFKKIDLYNTEQKSGESLLYYKVHRPTAVEFGSIYPIPEYSGACSAIETDINIDVFHLSNTQNGMTAQGMLSFFNGEPTNEDKRKIKQMFESGYTGPNKAGKTIFNFVNENQKGAEFLNLGASDLDKQFEVLAKRLQQKIITGHRVTNPVLFGIKTEGQLGNRNELLESFEHFTKTYIDLRRPHVLDTIKMFGMLAGVMYDEIYIEPLEPIGLELPLNENEIANSLTFDEKRLYIADKYNLELTAEDTDKDKRLTLANKLGAAGLTSMIETIKDSTIPNDQKVNMLSTIYGVTIKRANALLGIVEGKPLVEQSKGNLAQTLGVGGTQSLIEVVTNPALVSSTKAKLLVTLFGLPESVANSILGITNAGIEDTINAHAMSSEQKKDLILEALLSRALPPNEDEVIDSKCISSSEEAIEFESLHAQKFAAVVEGDVRTTRNAILDLLAGNPETKLDLIAKQLGLDVEYVQEQIDYMIEKSVISESVTGFTPTGKGLDKLENIEPVETEIYTVYKYAKREDVSGGDLLPTSRDFCKELIKAKGEFTRQDIDDLSNEFGTNVWVYRGGFYNDGKETTPYCRHVWNAYTKVRKKGAKK